MSFMGPLDKIERERKSETHSRQFLWQMRDGIHQETPILDLVELRNVIGAC